MLLVEVLRRAAHDWVLYRSSSRLIQRQLAEEAYHWLFDEEPGGAAWAERTTHRRELTSFISICDILTMDPEVVRGYVKRLTIKEILSTGRPPTYRRQKERKKKIFILPMTAEVEILVLAPAPVIVPTITLLRPHLRLPVSESLRTLFMTASRTVDLLLTQLHA